MDLAIVNLQTVGLIYDVAGILILGIPVMFRSVDRIYAQSGTYWDYSLPVAKALSGTTLDTFFGSILLTLGFALQIAAQLGFMTTPITGVSLLGLLLLSVSAYWIRLRTALTKRLVDRVHAKWEIEERQRAARRAEENT